MKYLLLTILVCLPAFATGGLLKYECPSRYAHLVGVKREPILEMPFAEGVVDRFLPEKFEARPPKGALANVAYKFALGFQEKLGHTLPSPAGGEEPFALLAPGTWHTVIIDELGMRIVPKSASVSTKHVAIARPGIPVRFAGEVYVDKDGTIYVSNDSGTYQTSPAHLSQAIGLLSSLLPGKRFVAVNAYGSEAYKQMVSQALPFAVEGALTPKTNRIFDPDFDIVVVSQLDGHGVSLFRLLKGTATRAPAYSEMAGQRPDVIALKNGEYKPLESIPIDMNKFMDRVGSIMAEYPQFKPHFSTPHQWSPEAQAYLKKHSWWVPSKLLLASALGRTTSMLPTGLEAQLRAKLLTYPDGSLKPDEVFRQAYVLAEGDLYLTLLTAQNVLADFPKRSDRVEANPVYKKLAYIRHDTKDIGDNYGVWYHLFGGALFTSVEPGWRGAGAVWMDSFLGRFISARDRQEEIFNRLSAQFGARLRTMADTGSYGNAPASDKDYLLANPSRTGN